MQTNIEFEVVKQIDVSDLKSFYDAQGSMIPHSIDKLTTMVDKSVCFVTARDRSSRRLIGIARGLADGVRGYLTECKLDPSCQGPAAVTHVDGRIEHDQFNIAKEMADRVIESLAKMGCERIDASAYGTEVDFCEELGFKRAPGLVPMSLNLSEHERYKQYFSKADASAPAGAAKA